MNEISYFEDHLPAELKQKIVNYLNFSDILSLCLASKTFNEFVGSSHDCMKKFWTKFYSFKLKDLDSLRFSSRCYEKLKVNRLKKSEHYEFLAGLNQPWRKILIYNSEFKNIAQFTELIESFSETIEELEISDIEILSNTSRICTLKFPRLKRIMFRNAPSTAIELFLGCNKSLESAAFDIAQEIGGNMSLDLLIKRFLENNQKLQHLQLGPHYIKSFFDREDANMDMQFKLSKLFLKFPIIRDESEDIVRNVMTFLSQQLKIDWIILWELSDDGILNTVWHELPLLSHVTVVGLEDLLDDSMDVTIEANTNIVHLELLCRKILLSQLKKFLAAAPCLQTLHVHTLTRYILECIVRNHQLLKEVRYENIEEEVPQIYNELKASADDINRSITFKKISFWHEAAKPFSLDPAFWHT